MGGMLRGVRRDWVLVVLQLAAVAFVLGPPSVRDAADFFTTGFATGANTAAVITVLLWATAVTTVLVITVSDIRRAIRWIPSSHATVLTALVIGVCCLGTGIARHEAASTFHPCCGSLTRAATNLGVAP